MTATPEPHTLVPIPLPIPIQTALISVSDKRELREFAAGLVELGIHLLSTGGTRRFLIEASLPAQEISDYTGFPEMMDGRLKTLHPKVFGGILARHERSDDRQSLADHQIDLIPLVVVNLYPFAETIARPGVTPDEAIEQIDIGGPSLIRAAAKNHAYTTIVTKSCQYTEVLSAIRTHGGVPLELRRRLAAEAFAMTAEYDRHIADYFACVTHTGASPFPDRLRRSWDLAGTLRYGENPHQQGALYRDPAGAAESLVQARRLHGKELSYNNYLDLDAALRLIREFPDHAAAAVVKHNNPCGGAISSVGLAEATANAMEGDPVSAFGSIVGLNRIVDAATAEVLCRPNQFIEAVVAPGFEPAAFEILTTKPKWKNNVRLMELGNLPVAEGKWNLRQIDGGLLVQEADDRRIDESTWRVVTETQPTTTQREDLLFTWRVVRHVRSNAIAVAYKSTLLGVGAGQMSRVDSVEIALRKGGDRIRGGVLASDAFFPFADSIELAAQAGITAIVQPGGSRNDPDVIASCNHHGIAMVFTEVRHFSH